MKASQLITNRFSKPPAVFTAETEILGATAAEWEAAWTGGFQNTFRELEERKKYVVGSTDVASCNPVGDANGGS